jgi:hypothetical protein
VGAIVRCWAEERVGRITGVQNFWRTASGALMPEMASF